MVFPAPLAPRNPKISPRATLKVMRSTATKSPNRLLSSRTDMIGSWFMVHQFDEYVFYSRFGGADHGVGEALPDQLAGERRGIEPVGGD